MAKRRRVAVGIALAVLLAIAALFLWTQTRVPRGSTFGEPNEVPGCSGYPPPGLENRPDWIAEQHDDEELRAGGPITHWAAPAKVQNDGNSPHGAFIGRVFDGHTRKSIARAELAFVQSDVVQTIETDQQGGYRFAPPAPGEWRLATLTAEGYLPYAPELGRGSVRFVARQGRRIERADLFLYPVIDYVGRVVDEAGQPVADAEVELFGAASGERTLIDLESHFRSDADGEFVFHAPEYAVLEATHPDHPPGRAQLDDAAMVSHTLTITLGQGGSDPGEPISGVLLAIEGTDRVGLHGIEVQAEPAPGISSLARAPTAITGVDGSFTLAPLDANAYVITAKIPGRPKLVSDVVEPGATVELISEQSLMLRVYLHDADGEPIASGTVALLAVEGVARRPVAAASFFDAQGQLMFEGIPAGDYEVQAIAQGYARAEPVRVSLPSRHPIVELTLEVGDIASGRVIDAQTREPIELALVSARGVESSDSVLPSLSSTVTDAEGHFRLFGLEPGRLSIQAVAFAHHGVIETDIETRSGLEFELQPLAEGERPKIELGFEDAVQNIRGQAGTHVTLDVIHADGSKTTLDVKRRLIRY